MPALAVADALRARGAEVRFVGARGAGASGTVTRAGYAEDLIPLRGFGAPTSSSAGAATSAARWRSPPGSPAGRFC